jgi:hypothetical protein
MEKEPQLTDEQARQQVDIVKAELEQLKQNRVELDNRIKIAEESYRSEVIFYLDANPESRLAHLAPFILTYAEEEKVDPKWLYYVIVMAASDTIRPPVRRSSIDKDAFPWPDPETHYNFAMSLIGEESHGNKMYSNPVRKAFQKAEELSKQQESEINDPFKMSVAYKWMHQNLEVLYEIHSRDWWDNY